MSFIDCKTNKQLNYSDWTCHHKQTRHHIPYNKLLHVVGIHILVTYNNSNYVYYRI